MTATNQYQFPDVDNCIVTMQENALVYKKVTVKCLVVMTWCQQPTLKWFRGKKGFLYYTLKIYKFEIFPQTFKTKM